MCRLLIISYCLLVVFVSHSQDSFFEKSDSVINKRLVPVSIGIGGVWAGSMIGLHEIWYKDVEKSEFHVFDDCSNWLQMDKVGHVYTAYKISELTGDLFKWSGVKPKTSSLIGSGIAFGYQSTLELFDAYSEEWGFSWCDMAANTLGTGIYLSQELLWEEQRIIPKFSYHPTEFASLRPEVLGSNFQERLLKDYNGQTYWLSFNPFLFTKSTQFPKWLCFSVGYSVNAKIVGDKEYFVDQTVNPSVTYSAQREFLLSLDIDFSRIPVKKPWLKVLLKQFNYLKVPFPTIILRDGKMIGAPLYF